MSFEGGDKLKVLYITNSVFNKYEGDADSTAGSDVQLTILESLVLDEKLNVNVFDCSASGDIKFESINTESVKGLKVSGYLRRLLPITTFHTLKHLYKVKPKIVVKYNLYIQQLLALIIYRMLFDTKVMVIVQDYRQGDSFTLRQRLTDSMCIKLLRFVDYCLPITSYISKRIPLKKDQKEVYSGGITKSCNELAFNNDRVIKKQAVFAGHLSEYNGLDEIISYWLENNISIDLVIYGDGPLRSLVENTEQRCKHIIFRGKVNQAEVLEEIQRSSFYFCLRYSRGIDAKYFYPSKFYIGLHSSAILLYNRFEGLLSDFDVDLPFVLSDDFTGLSELLYSDDQDLLENLNRKQQELLSHQKSWKEILGESIRKVIQN